MAGILGSIYRKLDPILPFDRYLDPRLGMLGGQNMPQTPMGGVLGLPDAGGGRTPMFASSAAPERVAGIPAMTELAGGPRGAGVDPSMGFGPIPQMRQPEPAMPQRPRRATAEAPRAADGPWKPSALDMLWGVAAGYSPGQARRALEQQHAADLGAGIAAERAAEEDAIARRVFADDERGYLAWRANREKAGEALSSGLEDYTLAPGAQRGRGGQITARAPFAPIEASPGTQVIDPTTGRVIASTPFKPEVVKSSPEESVSVVTPGAPGGGASADNLFAALIAQESGGRGDAVGPQTPYGQALGSTQMLPETAQAMAGKLGLPWRPELMTGTTAEALQYQQTLGRAYFDEGLARYGGDPAKALMYYHGGPDERLWGPNTRAYAEDVLARVGGGRAPGAAPGLATLRQGAPRVVRPATAEEKIALGIDPSIPGQIMPNGEFKPIAAAGKPMPAALQKAEDEDLEAIGLASGINANLRRYVGQIDAGTLNFGPWSNITAQAGLLTGTADEQARNFGSFKAGMEKLRNDSLRLNKGVQTEGDATRAWNELFANIRDEEFVRQRLEEIEILNDRAVAFKAALVQLRRARSKQPPLEGIEAFMPDVPDAPARTPPPAGAAPPSRRAPATAGAPRAGRAADPFPGVKDGDFVRQGGKRYQRRGNQMVEVR